MSLPASERLAPSRRQRALSAATTAQNLLWPVQLSSSHGDSSARPSPGLSARTGEPSDPIGMPASPSTAYSQREPTRSFFHSSFRGQPAPHDSQQYARDVREDTAELASYALSEQSRSMMGSSPRRSSSTHSNVGSHLDAWGDVDDDSATPHVSYGPTKPSVIEELSEPGTPLHEGQPYRSPGTSALADMLRRASTAASPPDGDIDSGEGDTAENTGDEEALVSGQGKNSAPSGADATEHTPLLRQVSQGQSQRPNYLSGGHDLEAQPVRRTKSWPKVNKILSKQLRRGRRAARLVSSPEKWDKKVIWQRSVVEPAGYIPAVVLGALLNVLDALSYGMILFPLGEPLFEKLGPAGISMFYVSCIVSQLVFSFGGSIFKGGVGSEMIEVVPFFHKMAFTILATVGEDNPKAVISTTITSYAISSILTGLVFFLMGVCRFGYIVGFIPRHILIGCIGGVGWFLIATGLEVTARLEGNLEYNWKTLHKLIQFDTVFQWVTPLVLGLFLYRSSKIFTGKYYLPTFILLIPAIFYFFVFSLPQLDIPQLREDGWIFDAPDADEPWWYFYTLYDFKLVHWGAVAENIPAMFALTFFGVLHVPINIPALAFNIGEDHLDLDRELVAHGISNALSGFAGSIQNYLVYTNSVLFIKSGGNSRVAGFILAVATFGVLLAGPGLIGYIPVMMVGVLIFVLGFELVFEAVWDPRKKLKPLEYLTVIAIVLVMGTYDFVVGIFVGIALAFVSLVVQTSRVPAVRASYSGEIAGSTVRRNPVQHDYLRQVGRQIHVTKLAGYLFFGTIVDVEARIRSLIKEEAFNHRPIRYLIFDLWHVTGIDYSAAEAFNRLNRIFSQKGVTIVMSGVSSESPIGLSLRNVGLGEGGNEVTLLPDLNSALESCENGLLKALYLNKDERNAQHARSSSALSRDVNARRLSTTSSHQPFPTLLGSPRGNHLVVAATKSLETEHENSTHKWQNFKEPLRLILQTFQGLTDKNEDFWFRAVPYFTRKEYAAGTTLFRREQPADGFYLLEDGILRADYDLPQGRYFESIVAGTTCGELPFFSETERTATVIAERDCVVWLMDRGQWDELQEKDKDVAQELLRITLKLTTERMSAITSYVLTTAG
ncbi:hypothetical protein V501_02298 [Pseudogymnoascus sp. VKM F-4519 (FW-2642)]|nr:hypothetical protein V501_02298 [Pseudogymnoascus sp. VKM F-4519 (FW-2642)]